MRSPDLLWRAAVVVAALLCAFLGASLGAPATFTGILAVVSLVVAGERLVRRRRAGLLDATLVLVGGLLVALVLVGLLVGLTSRGLDPTTWAVGVSLAAGAALALSATAATPGLSRPERRTVLATVRTTPWVLLAVAAAVVASSMTVRSENTTEDPPVQMAFGTVHGSDVQVVVSASARTGPLELSVRLIGVRVRYPKFTVTSRAPVTQTLTLPVTGRYRITLTHGDQTDSIRSLTLDR